jgi:hypothetical protein
MQQYLSFPCPLADTAHRIDANAGGRCSQEILMATAGAAAGDWHDDYESSAHAVQVRTSEKAASKTAAILPPMNLPSMFASRRELTRYIEERGGVVLAWESTPLWLRMMARMRPDLLRSWATMIPTGMRRAMIVPKSALSEEDRRAMREWQAQRRNTFERLNGRG